MITIFKYHGSFKVLQRIHDTMSKNTVIVIINTSIQQGNWIDQKILFSITFKNTVLLEPFCSKIPEKGIKKGIQFGIKGINYIKINIELKECYFKL